MTTQTIARTGKKLILVESPAKIKTISGYLGDEYIVKASVGHIRDLPLNSMGIDLETMTPEYVLTERGKGVVSGLHTLARNAAEVYLATDLDREGEAIAWHLQQVLNLKDNYKRIVFNEITKASILRAISNPTTIKMPMVKAQEARRLLDRVVGYVVSPELNKLKFTGKVSAGRVQSIVLKLVRERQLEIDKHKANEYYQIDSIFDNWTATFDGELNLPPDYVKDEKEPFRFRDKTTTLKLEAALKQYPNLTVADIVKKNVERNAPSPFTTSLLQQAASVHLMMSPDKTMLIAQSLYEKGLITYMRTDSLNLSNEAVTSIRDWIKAFITKKGPDYEKLLPASPNLFKSGDGAQEAHEAIRPSYINNLGNALEGDEKELYQLIWLRTVSSQCSPSVTAQTKVFLHSLIKFHNQPLTFVAIGEMPIFGGWKIISGDDKTDEKDDSDNTAIQKIPELAIGDVIKPTGYLAITKKTRPPKRYTEASIVKALETRGVGRPSTYAAVVNHVIAKKYICLESRMLAPTKLGIELYDALLTANFSFFNYEYTKEIEKQLDLIAQGRSNCIDVLKSEYKIIKSELPALDTLPKATKGVSNKPISESCKMCTKTLRKVKSKNGILYRCDTCDYFVPTKSDGQIDKQKIPTISSGNCPKCNTKSLLILSGQKGNYCKCVTCKCNTTVIY